MTLEPLEKRHVADLWSVLGDAPEQIWTYMGFGPIESIEQMSSTIDSLLEATGWVSYGLVVDGKAVGLASYLRISPNDGSIEIGSIVFSPALQRTAAATEAIFLMIDHVFSLGYRRCEWKCDSLNEPSRRAATRFGFDYEGTFKKATHYKGRNRDTSWYAIVDEQWPELRDGYAKWLDPKNFDSRGLQIQRLNRFVRPGNTRID